VVAILRDLRYALRMLWKDPWSSLPAIALIAIGIGASAGIFIFADALFWKPPAAPHPDRLVRVFTRNPRGDLGGTFSYPEYVALRDAASSFTNLAAEYPTAPLNLVADNYSREHNGAVVTANYFSLLGVRPIQGRFFRPEEDTVPDRDPVAVISARMWRSRFAAEPSTLGREIRINGVAFRVIGIAPENFYGDEAGLSTDVWIPAAMLRTGYRWCDAYGDLACTPLHIFGSLQPGQTPAAARDQLNSIAAAAHVPSAANGNRLEVLLAVGVRPQQQAELIPQIRLLLSIACTLMLIACANVAGLLLARGVVRRKEFMLRLAIGARPAHIARQLLVANLLFAALGGGLGLLLSFWISRAIVSFYVLQSEGGQSFYDLTLDWRVLLFCCAAALLTGLLFGLFPILQALQVDVNSELKSGGGSIGLRHGTRLRDGFAIVQIGLTVAMAVSAGLMARSARNLLGGANFDPDGVVALRLRPRLVKYSPQQAESFYRRAFDELSRTAAVESMAYGIGGSGLLWTPGTGPSMILSVAGQSQRPVRVLPVNDNYFSTLHIPVLQGRSFTGQDRQDSPRVLILNRSAALQLWPDASAVGRTVVLDSTPFRVVGVVADVGSRNAGESPAPQFYSAFWQSRPGTVGDVRMAVRVRGNLSAGLDSVHHAVAAADADVPISEDMPLIDQVRSVYASVGLARSVSLWCGAIALLLSGVGLYSVLAFGVRSRTREIGVRMALGATPVNIARLFGERVLLMSAIGISAGLGLALAATRLLSSLLYGVRATDLAAFVSGPLVVAIVAVLASVIPVRDAAAVQPLEALRHE
jgi:putative ABC transport system permease protein